MAALYIVWPYWCDSRYNSAVAGNISLSADKPICMGTYNAPSTLPLVRGGGGSKNVQNTQTSTSEESYLRSTFFFFFLTWVSKCWLVQTRQRHLAGVPPS
ncbi:hypothetical protein FKM82_013720 [Ascaphus truei]